MRDSLATVDIYRGYLTAGPAIDAGSVYVNVHTNDFVDPPNTGPGDFPGGEIRGQLQHDH